MVSDDVARAASRLSAAVEPAERMERKVELKTLRCLSLAEEWQAVEPRNASEPDSASGLADAFRPECFPASKVTARSRTGRGDSIFFFSQINWSFGTP
jgi:hypothetical protein